MTFGEIPVFKMLTLMRHRLVLHGYVFKSLSGDSFSSTTTLPEGRHHTHYLSQLPLLSILSPWKPIKLFPAGVDREHDSAVNTVLSPPLMESFSFFTFL